MSQEDSRIQHAQIIYQTPIAQNTQPIGYDKDAWMHKVNALTYSQYGTNLPPELSRYIHSDAYMRSTTAMNARSGNTYDWSPVVELANIPTSGDPSQVQQQYVEVQITPSRIQQVASAIRAVSNVTPTANGIPVVTEGANGPVIMSVPKSSWNSSVNQARGGSNFFTWLVNAFIGQSRGGTSG